MTLNRDQIKRDAEETIRTVKPDDSYMADDLLKFTGHCLALLTELEQAEQNLRDYAQEQVGVMRRYGDLEARLAKTPALVEALKAAMAFVDPATAQDYYLWREALAPWEAD